MKLLTPSILAVIALFQSVAAQPPYRHDLTVGEWATHTEVEKEGFGFYYLRIDKNFSGIFAYQHVNALGNSEEPGLLRFSPEQVILEDGYIAIKPHPTVRIVFSAYEGSLGTGAMWWYQPSDMTPYNSFYLRLWRSDPNKGDSSSMSRIRNIVKQLESSENDT